MPFELVYGASRVFTHLIETVDKYAPAPWPVLILGETGVGKELIARRIHTKSGPRAAPFIPVNCGAIPNGLFESELFGHERGAFSGATQAYRGLIRQAQGGTLFLDEVGELDLGLQVKLLRLLDSGEIRSVGSSRFEQVNVRIVAATNVPLPRAVAQGRFRQDLLERLSVLTVDIPPLRERIEDIPVIARHLLSQWNCAFDREALQALTHYEWPGNVRQLRNLLVRAMVRGAACVRREGIEKLLQEEIVRQTTPLTAENDFLEGSLAEIEKQVIVARLKRCGGNRKQAAEELGIAKSTLHEKLRKWKQDAGQSTRWPIRARVVGPNLGT